MKEEDMSNFDWVTARSDCSLVAIFERLKVQLEKDVEVRQKLREGPPYQFGFRFIVEGRTVTVIVEGNRIYDSVQFRLTDDAIEVRDNDGTVKLSATPTLNNEGDCRLMIKGQTEEQELWYVRKAALENLFFCSYDERVLGPRLR